MSEAQTSNPQPNPSPGPGASSGRSRRRSRFQTSLCSEAFLKYPEFNEELWCPLEEQERRPARRPFCRPSLIYRPRWRGGEGGS